MATQNLFDLLDDDAEDPSLLIAQKLKEIPSPAAAAPKKAPAQPAKLPSKPLPPAQAAREARNDGQRGGPVRDARNDGQRGGPVREWRNDGQRGGSVRDARNDGQRGGGRGGPRGGGRGRGREFNQESADDETTFGRTDAPIRLYSAPEDGEKLSERRGGYGGSRVGFRGGRRGGFSNGDAAEGERPRRMFDRRSGTGRGNDIKREGSGRGNWGTTTDEIALETEEPVNEGEKIVEAEKQAEPEDAGETNKDSAAAEPEEKKPEEKEMTLEEYEKVLEEKRKALLAQKPEERKVNLDKEFETMQLLSNKKNDEEIFVKLGSEKDKRKEAVEKAKKTKSINEFLKPAEGESYRPGGRGRGGRGRGRDGFGGGFSGRNSIQAPSIEDVGQFPSLAAK